MLRVQAEMDISEQEDSRQRDLIPELRSKAFAKALLQKAEDFLPGRLPAQRKKALEELLQPQADSLILSYSEQGTQMQGDRLRMGLAVKINTWELKEFLQAWGLYYTADSDWEYRLELEGELQEHELMLLQTLQEVSGLQRKDSGLPRLSLRKSKQEQGQWQGRLQTEDQDWTRTAEALPEVWKGLWEEYFSQEAVQAQAVQELVLQAQGWSGVAGIWEFDKSLASSDLIAERPRLIQLQLRRDQLQASWELRTRQQEKLQQELQQEMEPRGLEFNLRQAGESRQTGALQRPDRQAGPLPDGAGPKTCCWISPFAACPGTFRIQALYPAPFVAPDC
ncbi:MAG: hypothetical protein ACLFRL_05735 [Desulfohalobiaceae bacterium]